MGKTSQSKDDASLCGNCNGVGKTTALRLVNFCLAAKSNDELKKIPKEWSFCLEFELNGHKHLVERSIDNKVLALDEESIKLTKLQNFFDKNGPFLIDKKISGLSFRSLISHFMRCRHEDMSDKIVSVSSDQNPADALIRSLYLLGAEYPLAEEKKINAVALKDIQQQISYYRNIENDTNQNNKLAADAALASYKQRLEDLEAKISDMKIFELFDQIREQLIGVEKQIEYTSRQISINNYQLASIDKSLQYTPDMTTAELKGLYDGLTMLFKDSALEYFDKVEAFHKHMAENRSRRLQNDKLLLEKENKELINRMSRLKEDARKLEAQLKDRHSENEYQALLKEKNSIELKIDRLSIIRNEITSLEQRRAEIHSAIADGNLKAINYAASCPLTAQSQRFQQLMSQFGEDIQAGISLSVNEGKNQTQFNLTVSAQAGQSTGITNEMILAYDWLLLTHGSNHNLGFVWHDNALFADIDAGHRAKWMEFIYQNSIDTGKQYIMSINSENFEKSSQNWTDSMLRNLEERIVLKLSGENDTDKLLGISFDDDK